MIQNKCVATQAHSSLLDGVVSHCFIDKVAAKLYGPKDYEIALRSGILVNNKQ